MSTAQPKAADRRGIVSVSLAALQRSTPNLVALAEAEQRGERPCCDCEPLYLPLSSSVIVGYASVCDTHRT